jgi:regulator of protease activity HflC (stomatin/prohibitin superfamily)
MAKYVQPRTGQTDEDARKQVLLENLLKIEAEAASLANEAQAELGRRIDEAERQNRSRYEEQYGKAAAAHEAAYQQEIAGVKAHYKEELDTYQESLGRIAIDQGRFSALMTALLAGDA